MGIGLIDQAIELLEKANEDLQPELLPAPGAHRLLTSYARARRLADFGIACLSRKLDDPSALARVTGTSIGQAKAVVATGKVLETSGELSAAFQQGDISLEQAGEIAAAEESCPGAARELVEVAQEEAFHVLKDQARKTKLEAEQHRDLSARQHAARYGRSHTDDLGMVHIHLSLEPHVGTPIIARAEAEAARLARRSQAGSGNGSREPFERQLADAYAVLLSGTGKGRARRPELVVLVSHEVARRGWTIVRKGEVCKIPGVGPVSPQVAREIAQDAFLSGVFFDGKDLRNFARWTKNIPVEVLVALELGEPPSFDGVSCVDCGNRFRNEFDHVKPRFIQGATSKPNLKPRCWSCHQAKTKRDRNAVRATPPEP
ncbi:MAG TPA: HNH endonuclease signature motif containing protein [Actinomycetota bacterium]|nr:HNH endonuclease signature motif containing protein [Actinomycetota bacterium]